ncbi:MAG: gfo/Idh/MocA family oxidoreductase, partial [Verrucomicrobiota bacterium]
MKISRRKFVATATTAAISFPAIVRGQGLNEQLQVAFIATAGRANTHTKECHRMGLQCVTFADVDKRA